MQFVEVRRDEAWHVEVSKGQYRDRLFAAHREVRCLGICRVSCVVNSDRDDDGVAKSVMVVLPSDARLSQLGLRFFVICDALSD